MQSKFSQQILSRLEVSSGKQFRTACQQTENNWRLSTQRINKEILSKEDNDNNMILFIEHIRLFTII